MSIILRIAGMLAFAALFAALPGAAEAAAGKVIIKPNALTPLHTQQADYRTGILTIGTNDGIHWAMLKLPVGAKITGLSYRRWATNSGQTIVGVDRVQPGKSPSWERIYEGASTDPSPAGSIGTIVNGTFVGSTRKVQAGWDYFVLTSASGTAIGEITVKYQTP